MRISQFVPMTKRRVWILIPTAFRVKYIKADPPCMKGEINMGWITIGWQASGRTA
jgi:hypothetical protein